MGKQCYAMFLVKFSIVRDNCSPTYLERYILFYFKISQYVIYRKLGSMLEEVGQQPSINTSFWPVPQLVKMNNFFGQYL